MSKFTERFTQLNKRARIVLAAGAALALIAVVGGALLAGNPPLLARLSGRLLGSAVNGCEIEPYAQCPGADLRGVHLYVVHLWGANLRGADFTDAVLGDNEKDISMAGADLSGARLDRVQARGLSLGKANLSNASLSEAHLCFADLVAADLRGANLARTDLCFAPLMDADLSNANLTGALLLQTRLNGVNLTNANLSDAKYADLTDAVLLRTVLPDGTLGYANTDKIPSDPPPGGTAGVYQVRPRHVDNMCLSGSALFYTRIWQCSNQADDKNQRWTFVPSGNFYQVKIGTSGWCLTVENAALTAGATVTAAASAEANNAHQLWRLDAVGDGGYRLVNKHSGLCAAPKDGGTANDTVTVQLPCTSDAARSWGLHMQ
jgi:uncharacterized protein YjbI with pentapeptide repeats